MTTTRAYRVHQFGELDQLRLDTIDLQPDERRVLIETHAVSVNPVDIKTLRGSYPLVTAQHLPYTLGRDVAGVVSSVPQGETRWRPGDRVFAFVGQDQGSFADYVLVQPEAIAAQPSAIDEQTAAAVPLAALTAWQGLFDHGRLTTGERVLIHGAAGGLGHFAVQFAKAAGAYVIATVSGDDMEFVRSLGADKAIDYKAERFEDECRDMDLVLDLVGGQTQQRSWSVIKRGGRLVSTLGEPSKEEAAKHEASGARFTCEPNGEQLMRIAKLIDAQQVRVHVAERYAFEALTEALERLVQGHVRGKIVVRVR